MKKKRDNDISFSFHLCRKQIGYIPGKEEMMQWLDIKGQGVEWNDVQRFSFKIYRHEIGSGFNYSICFRSRTLPDDKPRIIIHGSINIPYQSRQGCGINAEYPVCQ